MKNSFQKSSRVVLIVLVSFGVYYLLFQNFKTIKVALDKLTHHGLVSYILTYFFIGIPLFFGTYFIDRKKNIFKDLGIGGNIIIGLCASLLFTLPMFIGGAFYFNFIKQIDIESLIAGTLVAGFMEELYFRGFLFGHLFKKVTLGFIPSIFLGALVFAFGHLYQSENINELIGIFLITFSGAVFFAWLYVEWDFNLWVPIFTHTFMNLSWNVFTFDSTALGDMKANLFRGLTIITAIVFTIVYKRNQGEKLNINKLTLMVKRDSKI